MIFIKIWLYKKLNLLSGAKDIEAISSTNLRKYVATVMQIMSLSDEELDWVAIHLGHDIRVHRDFYRLQESTLELAKVSKLLLAAEKGEVHKNAGTSLTDMKLQLNPTEGEQRLYENI